MDGQGREESKRLSGGRERRAAGKIRRGNGTKESHGQQWLEFVLLIAHDMVKEHEEQQIALPSCGWCKKDGMCTEPYFFLLRLLRAAAPSA